MVKDDNKNSRTMPGVVLVSLLLTLNTFDTLCVSIVNFEQVNPGWEYIPKDIFLLS